MPDLITGIVVFCLLMLPIINIFWLFQQNNRTTVAIEAILFIIAYLFLALNLILIIKL